MFLLATGYLFYATYTDVNAKLRAKQEQIMLEIDNCGRDYKANECDPSTRREVLESYCVGKEKCMNRDPFKVRFQGLLSHRKHRI